VMFFGEALHSFGDVGEFEEDISPFIRVCSHGSLGCDRETASQQLKSKKFRMLLDTSPSGISGTKAEPYRDTGAELQND
jgi:hypothetical protein